MTPEQAAKVVDAAIVVVFAISQLGVHPQSPNMTACRKELVDALTTPLPAPPVGPMLSEQLERAVNAICDKFNADAEEVDGAAGELSCFILCERHRSSGEMYFSGHQTPEDALRYSEEQECADRWSRRGLYDVAAGKWFTGKVVAQGPMYMESFSAP